MDEDGSDLADELWGRARERIASLLVYPEARAALAAAARAGRIDGAALRTLAADLDDACNSMTLIAVDMDLARDAGDLAERHALRGYDAVHLATALRVGQDDLLLATWDRDLARAGLDAGLSVAPALDR